MPTKPLTRRTKKSPFRRPRKQADATANRSSAFDEKYFLEENYQYKEWYVDQAKKILTRIFASLHPKKDWVFLDVGCALGGIVEVCRRRGYEAYGIDLSRWCIRNAPVGQYLHFGSVTNLPCADQSVDVSICIDTFQYLTRVEAKKAAKELRRVTRKYLCFESITLEDEKHSDPKENPDTVRKHRSLLSREEFIQLFTDEGFRLKKKGFLPRTIEGSAIKGWFYEYDFSFNAIFEVV